MTNSLKTILLNIARLPSIDQRWILRQLPRAQKTKFEALQGPKQLKEARRFRRLTAQPTQKAPHDPLPLYCLSLATQAPLYIAIILEQGTYPWQAAFLKQFDTSGLIRTSLEQQVMDIKPQVKQVLFSEWENSLSFESYLEEVHG